LPCLVYFNIHLILIIAKCKIMYKWSIAKHCTNLIQNGHRLYITGNHTLHFFLHLLLLNLGLNEKDDIDDEEDTEEALLLLPLLGKLIFFLKLSLVSSMKRSRACLKDECFLSNGLVYIFVRARYVCPRTQCNYI
jgi:hypothetical protein